MSSGLVLVANSVEIEGTGLNLSFSSSQNMQFKPELVTATASTVKVRPDLVFLTSLEVRVQGWFTNSFPVG